MKAHLIDTHLVPRSRSSAKVKVKYQGHVSQKMGISGAFMFNKHILFFFFFFLFTFSLLSIDASNLLRSKILLLGKKLAENYLARKT